MIFMKRWKYTKHYRLGMKAQRQSAFFVKDELRICALRLVRANQDEIHVCQNAEAAIPIQLGFQLVSEIRGLII